MTRWSVNTIAVFTVSKGPLSSWAQYKRDEYILIGRSTKGWRRKKKKENGETEQLLAFVAELV